jgi:hypothetical protein
MKKKSYDYYKLDVGFYPDVMKVCFSDKVFQQILKDHKVTIKADALDIGVAETHLIGDGKDALIILVFDLDALNDGIDEVVGAIAHEVSHAIDNLAEYIGEDDNIEGETRAYLTESLVRQIFKITMAEKNNNARKADRKISRKKGNGERGPDVQVVVNSNGGAGSVSISEQSGPLGGAKDGNRPPIA